MPTLSYFPSQWPDSVFRYVSWNRSVTGYEIITRRTPSIHTSALTQMFSVTAPFLWSVPSAPDLGTLKHALEI